MSWWKRLKLWQKTGVMVGSIHLVMYMSILLLIAFKVLHSEAGWILWLMELPWVGILGLLRLELVFGPTPYTDMVGRGLIGTLIYAFFSMSAGWLASIISLQINRVKK